MNCGGCVTTHEIPPELREKTEQHPCYSFAAHHTHARMHLPVAPKCNIGCNYCNRKFDCVNESRPGVTSEVLTPELALHKFKLVKEKIQNLSVVGIAGPGDALANWDHTSQTLKLIRQANSEVTFCLSTNGLLLPQYAQEIVEFGIRHVTVTVNCLEPQIGAKIYKFVNYNGKRFTGAEGAFVLLGNQLSGIEYLAQQGVLVKVNIVMIKGVNDWHIPQVVKKVKQLGAFITNIMPLIPAPGSAFEEFPQTSRKDLNTMRETCELDLQQMHHCKQCRADAIGLLGEDRSAEFRLSSDSTQQIPSQPNHYRIAVTSKYGRLIDQHFGHTTVFNIYQGNGDKFELVETRSAEKYCAGVEECDADESRERIIHALKDCDAVLTMRIGYHAKERLLKHGVLSVESCDSIENGLNYAVRIINEHSQEIA